MGKRAKKVESAKKPRGEGFSRNEIVAIVIFVVLAVGYTIFQIATRQPKPGVELGEDIELQPKKIVVQVDGAVMKPGMVNLTEGARVIDAIQAAGGFSEDADTESVNGAKIVQDQERIYVPSKNDRGNLSSAWDTNTNRIRGVSYYDNVDSQGRRIVNVNTANVSELMELPGIGETLAGRIVEYRKRNGPFEKVEDLMMVEGIGEGKLAAIRALVTTGGD